MSKLLDFDAHAGHLVIAECVTVAYYLEC